MNKYLEKIAGMKNLLASGLKSLGRANANASIALQKNMPKLHRKISPVNEAGNRFRNDIIRKLESK